MGVRLDRGTHSALFNLAANNGDVELASRVFSSESDLGYQCLPADYDAFFIAHVNSGDVVAACRAFTSPLPKSATASASSLASARIWAKPSSEARKVFVDHLVACAETGVLPTTVRDFIRVADEECLAVHPDLLSTVLAAAGRVGDFLLASDILMQWDGICRRGSGRVAGTDATLHYRPARIQDWNSLLQSCVNAFTQSRGDLALSMSVVSGEDAFKTVEPTSGPPTTNTSAPQKQAESSVGGSVSPTRDQHMDAEPSAPDQLMQCARHAINFLHDYGNILPCDDSLDESEAIRTRRLAWTKATHELVLLLQLRLHPPPTMGVEERIRASREAFMDEWAKGGHSGDEAALAAYLHSRRRSLLSIAAEADPESQLESANVRQLPKV